MKPYDISRMCIAKDGVYCTKTYLRTEIARRFQAPQNQSPYDRNGNVLHPKVEKGQTLR